MHKGCANRFEINFSGRHLVPKTIDFLFFLLVLMMRKKIKTKVKKMFWVWLLFQNIIKSWVSFPTLHRDTKYQMPKWEGVEKSIFEYSNDLPYLIVFERSFRYHKQLHLENPFSKMITRVCVCSLFAVHVMDRKSVTENKHIRNFSR